MSCWLWWKIGAFSRKGLKIALYLRLVDFYKLVKMYVKHSANWLCMQRLRVFADWRVESVGFSKLETMSHIFDVFTDNMYSLHSTSAQKSAVYVLNCLLWLSILLHNFRPHGDGRKKYTYLIRRDWQYNQWIKTKVHLLTRREADDQLGQHQLTRSCTATVLFKVYSCTYEITLLPICNSKRI